MSVPSQMAQNLSVETNRRPGILPASPHSNLTIPKNTSPSQLASHSFAMALAHSRSLTLKLQFEERRSLIETNLLRCAPKTTVFPALFQTFTDSAMDNDEETSNQMMEEIYANGGEHHQRPVINGEQLDIKAYAALYSGRTKTARLLFIADNCDNRQMNPLG